RHAEFVIDARGVGVRDLHSRNGILVNGAKVSESVLRPGDVVQVGHLRLRYMEEAAPISTTIAGAAADATVAVRQAFRGGAQGPAAPAPQVVDDNEKTRMVAPPRAATPPPAM